MNTRCITIVTLGGECQGLSRGRSQEKMWSSHCQIPSFHMCKGHLKMLNTLD